MQNQKKILIIGFLWPEPKSSAAGNRMMQLIDLFQEKNYSIFFASTAQNIQFSENLTQKNITTKTIDLNSSLFDNYIQNLNPDIVLFDRFMTEEQFGWRVSESCKNALKILDTEDLHCLRLARQEAIKNNKPFTTNNLFTDTAKREIASVLRCDLSLFVSQYEIDLLQNLFKISSSLLYYLPLFAEKGHFIKTYDQRTDFVFIGNFLHQPNYDCIVYLAKNIWPIIHQQLPKSKMFIYGAYPTQKVLELHKPTNNFFIYGRAENALQVVGNAKVLLAPLRFGAGIKGKLLEAMQKGTPTVTTSIGAESMHGNLPWNGFIANDPGVFANQAVMLYNDEQFWHKSQQNGFVILENRYKKSLFDNAFMQAVEMILNDLTNHRNNNFLGSILLHHTISGTKYMSKWIEEKNKNT